MKKVLVMALALLFTVSTSGLVLAQSTSASSPAKTHKHHRHHGKKPKSPKGASSSTSAPTTQAAPAQ